MSKDKNISSDGAMTYEKAMEKLAETVRTLDGGKLSLDESVKLFEEGAALAKFCDECLKDAEFRIKRLSEEPENNEADE